MVASFNACNVDVACIGNHDLDFGIEQMDTILKQTMAPEGGCQWIMTNLVQEDRPLDGPQGPGCCIRSTVIEKAGQKIGFMGIAEREWANTFKNLEVDLIYSNYKRTATEYAKKLREEQGCTYIIALTHMRLKHDKIFAREIPGIDLVLGGHDHEYYFGQEEHQLKTGAGVQNKVVPLVKSGCDFKDLTEIDIIFGVTQDVVEEIKHEFVTKEEEQTQSRTKLVYSEADETFY